MTFFNRKKTNLIKNFPPIGGLMVSKLVAEKKKKPMFMYREKRSRPEDSGWRIFSGMESEDYTDDPKNAGIYAASTILAIDTSIADILLNAGVGSVFERTSDKSEWYRVYDFPLEDDYMVKHKLTDSWILEINNLFERTVENTGDIFYTTGDKSLRLAVWDYHDKTKAEVIKEHLEMINTRDTPQSKILERFDFSDEQISRIGYMILENDDNKEYNVIYAFSITDKQVLQIALYFDEDKDIDWATSTWKGITIHK